MFFAAWATKIDDDDDYAEIDDDEVVDDDRERFLQVISNVSAELVSPCSKCL